MPLVLSTDIEPVKVQALGNWFEFKPAQIKLMQKDIADFLTMDKREYGFVALPESLEDEDRSSEVFKKAVAEAQIQGRRNIVAKLNRLRFNLEVSMKKDLEMAGIKADPVSFCDDKEAVKAMYRKLAMFKDLETESVEKDIDEIQKLKEALDGPSNRANTKPATQRS